VNHVIGVAALLSALRETNEPTPQGLLYMALMGHGYSLDEFYKIVRILIKAGFATVDGSLIVLTDKGRLAAEAIDAEIEALP